MKSKIPISHLLQLVAITASAQELQMVYPYLLLEG